MSFNAEQLEHMESLARVPSPERCWCGWYRIGECFNCPTGYSLEQRQQVECPSCHNFPSPGKTRITHIKGCPEEPSSRVINKARLEQGFVDQAHLDRFFVYLDHTHACPECGKPGPAHWSIADASWQPTVHICEEGQRLSRLIQPPKEDPIR